MHLTGIKPYRAMKDSGVEWLEEVPAHWTTERLKSLVTNVVEQGAERRGNDMYVALEHVESWTGRLNGAGSDVETYSQLKRFAPGDVLFGKLRPYLAKVTRPTKGGRCVGEFLVLRPRDTTFDTGFLERLLRAKPIVDNVDASTFGAKMPRAEWTFIGSMKIVKPPLSEQAAIVRFLDHADCRIQRYIRAKEKLIALLEDQKQAIIHETVTGRIDVRTGKPYAAYKESDVRWLGQIPRHWDRVPLRAVAKSIQTGPFGSQLHVTDYVSGGVPVINPSHFVGGTIVPELSVSLTDRKAMELRRHRLQSADLVMARRGELGRCAIVGDAEVGWICGTGSLRIRPDLQIVLPEYLAASIGTRAIRDALSWSSVGATMENLNAGIVSRVCIPLPSVEDQLEIVEHLTHVTRKTNGALLRVREQIKEIVEYRTRLIADVVTGKIDVREAAAALPEEPGPSGHGRVEVEDDAGIQTEALEMTDWDTCPAVERKPGKVSGAWVFVGTRIPLSALYENLASGATISEFIEWFPGVDEQQVRAVLEHEAKALRTAAAP